MLVFNELRITDDNKCLIIDASVENLSYFDNVKIGKVFIETQKTWIADGPSKKAIPVYEPNVIEQFDVVHDTKGKHIRLEIPKPVIDMSKYQMYFVYIKADITNAPEALEAPCSCSKDKIVGVAINMHYMYNLFLKGIKDLEKDCSNQKNFTDLFLRFWAVNSSIKAGNYPLAIKYWNMFFDKNNEKLNYKPCGCYGRF